MTKSTPKGRAEFARKTIVAVIKDTQDEQAERIEYLVDENLSLKMKTDKLERENTALFDKLLDTQSQRTEFAADVVKLKEENESLSLKGQIAFGYKRIAELKADLAQYKKFVERQPPMPVFVGLDYASDFDWTGAINNGDTVRSLRLDLSHQREELEYALKRREYWQKRTQSAESHITRMLAVPK